MSHLRIHKKTLQLLKLKGFYVEGGRRGSNPRPLEPQSSALTS
jgi:hypothetical protein